MPAKYGSARDLARDLLKLVGMSFLMLIALPFLYLRNWLDRRRTRL